MIWGIDLSGIDDGDFAQRVVSRCFDDGLVIERVGRDGTVIKLLPPLTIEASLLDQGCAIIKQAIQQCLSEGSIPDAVPLRVGTTR
jgi:diaminobutyrate-2-oxoglutarate transaminase